MALPDAELTERIIACAYRVHNTLEAGFLEKVTRTRWRSN